LNANEQMRELFRKIGERQGAVRLFFCFLNSAYPR
jgi:hypothetical protein